MSEHGPHHTTPDINTPDINTPDINTPAAHAPQGLLKPHAHALLMGLRCSGKSTVGPLLAAELGRDFVDLDTLTTTELGTASTGDALRTLGEPAFRAGELHALVKLIATARRPLVLALGGGTPTYADSRDVLINLRSAGTAALIYLRAKPTTLAQRMAATDVALRPALLDAPGGGDALAEIDELFTQRDPLYRAMAHRTIEIDTLSAPTAALVISAWLNAQTSM